MADSLHPRFAPAAESSTHHLPNRSMRGQSRPGKQWESRARSLIKMTIAHEAPGIAALVVAALMYSCGASAGTVVWVIVTAYSLTLAFSVAWTILRPGHTMTFALMALRIGFLMFYFVPGFLYLWQHGKASVVIILAYASPEAYLKAVIYAIVMYYLAIITATILAVVFPTRPSTTTGKFAVGASSLPYVVGLAFGALLLFIVVSGGVERAIDYIRSSRMSGAPWKGEEKLQLRPIIYFIHGILNISGSLIILTISRIRMARVAKSIYLGIALLVLAIPVLERGTRSQMFFPILTVLYSAQTAWNTRPSRRGRATWRSFLVFLMIGLISIAISNYIRHIRYVPSSGSGGSLGEADLFRLDDMNFMNESAIAVELTDRLHLRLRNPTVLMVLTTPLPRVLFPWKPDTDTSVVYTYYRTGIDAWKTGYTAMPGVVGQWYMDWGILGLLYGALLLGLIVYSASRFLSNGTDSDEWVWPKELLALALLAYVIIAMRAFSRLGVLTIYLAYPTTYALGYLRTRGGRHSGRLYGGQ